MWIINFIVLSSTSIEKKKNKLQIILYQILVKHPVSYELWAHDSIKQTRQLRWTIQYVRTLLYTAIRVRDNNWLREGC